jgi:hypothetical protein
MKVRIWTVAAGLAAVAALIAVPAAMAAYASPKLQVSQAGNVVTIKASEAADDDATAAAYIVAPAGTTLTTSQAPGTVLGPVKALIIATALANAQLPVTGQLLVAAPGQVPDAVAQACVPPAETLRATWIMALNLAGSQINLPVFLTNEGVIAVCLPHPSQATAGAKLVSAEFSVAGVFSPVQLGAWIAIWLPYGADAKPNPAGTVASPAAIAPGAVTIKAKKVGAGALVAGVVTQAGQGRGGAVVAIWGAKGKAALRRLGTTRVGATGVFAFKAKSGDVFQARAVAASGSAPPLCTQVASQLGGVPCVNPTVNGFTAQSKTVRKR